MAGTRAIRALFWVAFLAGAYKYYDYRTHQVVERDDDVESAAAEDTVAAAPSASSGPRLWIEKGSAESGARPMRVLFIGNSMTHTQSMPKMVVALASESGIPVEVAQYAPGGYRLQQHASDQRTHDIIAAGGWDVTVLQENSQLTEMDDASVRAEVDPYARALATTARAANPSARIVLYMTPAHENGEPAYASAQPQLASYDGAQDRIDATYRRLARDLDAAIAPAGVAWQTARRLMPTVSLYADGDRVHPNRQGAYLVACVFFGTLFNRSPVGLNYTAELDASLARQLQREAWQAVQQER